MLTKSMIEFVESTPDAIREAPGVLVRAFDGKPSRLVVVERDTQYVYVASTIEGARVGVPWVSVFEDDPTLFAELQSAYSGGEWEKVANQWARAQHYTTGGSA